MTKITYEEAMAEFFPEGVPWHLVKRRPQPAPKAAVVKAQEVWSGNKPLSAVLQDAQRAEEAATKQLRDKRTQAEKDHDAGVKAEYDLAWRQASIDAAWQRNLDYQRELAQWRAGTCHRGPGDPDW